MSLEAGDWDEGDHRGEDEEGEGAAGDVEEVGGGLREG